MRRTAVPIEARLGEGGEISAPCPGLWRDAPAIGDRVAPGMLIGRLEVLGAVRDLIAPAGASGVVVAIAPGPELARRAVDAGTMLVRLDASATVKAAEGDPTATAGPVFRSPLGGRYYARPAPGAEPFAKIGDVLRGGETVALIEVMKTFNRVQIAGVKLPAIVLRIAVQDGDDLQQGQILLELGDA